MIVSTLPLITLDTTGSIDSGFGISQDQLHARAPAMDQLRDDFLAEIDRGQNHFFGLPMQQYQAYQDEREASPLGQVFDVGTGLHDQIDAVVVIGDAQATAPAMGIFQSCCDPYHNELSRAQRGSRPRMYFAGDRVDNDDLASLLNRLGQRDFRDSPVERRWAIVPIDPLSDDAKMVFQAVSAKVSDPARLVLPIVQSGSWLDRQSESLGCERVFALPSNSVCFDNALSVASLLPAAMLGLDCIKLLEGAVMMNEHFKSATFDDNVVLRWLAVQHGLAQHRGITSGRMRIWPSSLEWLPAWYQSIHRKSPASPSSKAVITNMLAEKPRYDPMMTIDDKDSLVGKMAQSMDTANQVDRDNGVPTMTLRLPTVDTRVIGQLFQMLTIATKIDSPALPHPV